MTGDVEMNLLLSAHTTMASGIIIAGDDGSSCRKAVQSTSDVGNTSASTDASGSKDSAAPPRG